MYLCDYEMIKFKNVNAISKQEIGKCFEVSKSAMFIFWRSVLSANFAPVFQYVVTIFEQHY